MGDRSHWLRVVQVLHAGEADAGGGRGGGQRRGRGLRRQAESGQVHAREHRGLLRVDAEDVAHPRYGVGVGTVQYSRSHLILSRPVPIQ